MKSIQMPMISAEIKIRSAILYENDYILKKLDKLGGNSIMTLNFANTIVDQLCN